MLRCIILSQVEQIRSFIMTKITQVVPNHDAWKDTGKDHLSKQNKGIVNVEENSSENIEGQLYDALKPLLICMKIMGLYYEKPKNLNDKYSGIQFHISKIYSTTIVLILGLNCLRLLTMFDASEGFKPVTFSKATIIAWTLTCFCGAISCHRAGTMVNGLPEFFRQWSVLHEGVCMISLKKIRRCVILYTVLCFLFAIKCTAFTIYGFFYTEYFNAFLSPMPLDNPYIDVFKYFACAIQFLFCCAWSFSAALDYVICRVVYREFIFVNKLLSDQVNGRLQCKASFEQCRQVHQGVCRLVELADEVFSFYHAAIFVLNIVTCCLILYNMLWDPMVADDVVVCLTHVFWFTLSLANITVISVAGGLVNHAVSILEYLFNRFRKM